jgi:hypothetical protein
MVRGRSMRGFSVIASHTPNAKSIKINKMVEILASLVTQSRRAEKVFFACSTGELSNIHISGAHKQKHLRLMQRNPS